MLFTADADRARSLRVGLPARDGGGLGGRRGARRRPRAGDAPRRLPRRPVPDARGRGAGHGLVEPAPARRHPARRLPPVALAAADAAALRDHGRPRVRRRSSRAAPTRRARAAGSRARSAPRTPSCTRSAGRTRSRPGTRTARSPAGSTGRDRRPVRRRVEVPRAHGRVQGRGRGPRRAAAGGRRRAAARRPVDDGPPAHARRGRRPPPTSTCGGCAAALALPPALG